MPHFSLLCILLFSSCTADYALNSQVNTAIEPTHAKIGENCQNDATCEPGSRCVEPKLENCQNDINCALLRTRGDLNAKCRKLCDLNLASSECPASQRCVFHVDSKSGVCLNGICDNDEDCGKNNALLNKCLDKTNGIKSGICALSCNPLRCHKGVCPDCPESQTACEHMHNTTDFICIIGGDALAFSACNNETLFCSPGHFCYENQCRPYCNAKQEPTTCVNNTWCRDFFPGSEIGFCEVHEKETN